MNIAIFTDTYLPQINGVVTSICTFQKALEEMGHTIYIICPKMQGANQSTDKVFRFSSFQYPFQKEYRLSIPYSRKIDDLSDLDIDLIHVQTPFTLGYLGMYLANKYQIPAVHTYHTLFIEYVHYFPLIPKKLAQKWFLKESKRFCNKYAAIIAPSHEIEDHLIDQGVTRPIHVLPSAIDPYIPSEEEIRQFQDEYDLSERRCLIFIGRLGKEKNIYFLIEVLDRLRKRYPDILLLFIGDGPERLSMEADIAERGLQDHVLFTGYLEKPQVFTAIASSVLSTFPSKTETQGLGVIECLSQGVPSVCIDAMGVKTVLADNQGGVLTKDNPDDYFEAVCRFLDDDEYYKAMSESARRRANDFSPNTQAKSILSIYESAIREGVPSV